MAHIVFNHTLHLRSRIKIYVLPYPLISSDLAIMTTKQIGIWEVISRIKTGEDGDFTLVVIRSSGKLKGHEKVFARARYGAPEQAVHQPSGKRGGSNSEKHLTVGAHKENGTIPITDLETRQYKSPLISHIIGYNGRKVIH